jgi:histone deacetylase 11
MKKKVPIVFSKVYDVALGGTEGAHPAEARRYGKIFNHLSRELSISEDDIYEPYCASDEELLSVHTRRYLDSLCDSETIARIAEFKFLASIPNSILQEKLLKSVRYAVGGTLRGSELALEHGWAVNLSGGYHHAKADEGGGFCFFSDIAIAASKLKQGNERTSVLIVDLDAHQGNGYASIFEHDEYIAILDVYNEDIYPRDTEAKEYIRFHHPLPSRIEDEAYLSIIRKAVPRALEEIEPGIVYYIAGADLYREDVLGQMSISAAGIIKRDEIVFENALSRGIPVLMLLGGGYTEGAATIMGRSIVHLIKTVITRGAGRS